MATEKRGRRNPPEVCPVCGEEVPPTAFACPECGADHNSGWRDEAHTYDAVDLGDEDFDYEEFVRGEFGQTTKPSGIKTIWWITGIFLLVVIVALYVVLKWPIAS